MTLDLARGVYATAEMHFDMVARALRPVLSIRLAALLDDELPAQDCTLQHLRSVGWGHPARLLRGAGCACRARATVDGALSDDGPLTVAGGGLILFNGPVDRTERWIRAVRTAASVPVVLCAAGPYDDLGALARHGLALAAQGYLFHRGPGVAHPVL